MALFSLAKAADARLFQRYGENPYIYYNVRILTGAVAGLLLIVLCLIVVSLLLPSAYYDAHTKAIFVPLEIVIVAGLAASLALLLKGRPRGGGHLFAGVCSISVGGAILLTGGFPMSVASTLLLLVPILAFCLASTGFGLLVTLFLPVIAGVQWIALAKGWITLPDFSSSAAPGVNVAMVFVVTYICSCFVVGYYCVQNRFLRSELSREQQKLTDLAARDDLTGLHNGRHFNACLASALSAAALRPTRLTVLYLDLDNFKPINDTLGHDIGDIVLQKVADRLKGCVRSSDIIARIGGDEFAVLVDNMANPDADAQVVERINSAMHAPIEARSTFHQIRVSFGLASYPQDGQNRADLMRAADKSMYQEKRRKKRMETLRTRPGGNR